MTAMARVLCSVQSGRGGSLAADDASASRTDRRLGHEPGSSAVTLRSGRNVRVWWWSVEIAARSVSGKGAARKATIF